MDILLLPFLQVISIVLGIYQFFLIAYVILSWGMAFGIVNTYNPVVAMISEFLFKVTQPLLDPIRSLLPRKMVIDLSPMLLMLAIIFADSVLNRFIVRYSMQAAKEEIAFALYKRQKQKKVRIGEELER